MTLVTQPRTEYSNLLPDVSKNRAAVPGERAENAGFQRQRQARNNRSGAVAAAGQKQQRPDPGTEEG